MYLFGLAICLATLSNFCDCGSPKYSVVNIEYGKIRGILEKTLYDRKEYYAFKGIPYALPPVGNLRFKPPQKATSWSGTLDTFEFASDCLQADILSNTILLGEEDCLYLNVFVPAKRANDKLAVLVNIYGGAFTAGGSSTYGPDFLINQDDIIIVTLNYRLGPLGFLSLNTPELSGNMALKDQQLALKWVKENIANFGGDDNKITIMGESAGGVSVHFQMIAPGSKGLFNRVIPQSGVSVSLYGYYSKNNHTDILSQYALANGAKLDMDDTKQLTEYLSNIDPKKFVLKTAVPFFVTGLRSKSVELVWSPVIEREDAMDPFITEHPEEILRKGLQLEVDAFIGYNSAEAILFVAEEYTKPYLLEPFNEYFEFVSPLRGRFFDYNSEVYQEIKNDTRCHYFGCNGPVNKETFNQYVQLISDGCFVYIIDKTIKYQVALSSGKTFYYKFDVDSRLNAVKDIYGVSNLFGVAHGEDVFYYFRFAITGAADLLYMGNTRSDIYQYINMVAELFTNFAKTGDPSTKEIIIKPVTKHEKNYVHITNDGLVTGVNPNDETIKFFDGLYTKYDKYILEEIPNTNYLE